MNNSINLNVDNNDENKLYQYATLRPLQQKNETKQFTNKSNNFFRNSFNELNLIDAYNTLIDDVSSTSSSSTSTKSDETQSASSLEPLRNSKENISHHTSSVNDTEPDKVVDQCLYELDAYLEAIENSTSLDQSIVADSSVFDDDTAQLLNLSGATSLKHQQGFSTFPKNKTRHDREQDRTPTFDEPSSFLKLSHKTSLLTPTHETQSSLYDESDIHSAKGSSTFNRGHPQRNTIVTCTRSSMGNSIEEGLDIESEQQLRKSRLKKTGLLIYFYFYYSI